MNSPKAKTGLILVGVLLAAVLFLAWKLCLAPSPTSAPALSAHWHRQLYGLDPDEAIRFVPSPYSPQRMKDFGRSWTGAPPQNNLGQLTYHVTIPCTLHWGMSSASGTVFSAIEYGTNFTLGDLDISQELREVPADGDVIVRIDASVDRRMKALESILSVMTAKDLIFEKKPAERDVIVARGHWQFHPLSGGRPRTNSSVHFYTATLDAQEGAGGGSGNLSQVLHRLEEITGRKVIDEVTDRPANDIDWANNYSEHHATKNEPALAQLLDNVAKQTSLEFVRTKRLIPIWFVREKAPAMPADYSKGAISSAYSPPPRLSWRRAASTFPWSCWPIAGSCHRGGFLRR